MSQKGYDLIGLAQRAGQIQSGDASAEAAVLKGKASLILLAADASDRTREHFVNLAESRKIPWIQGGEKLLLGAALGKSPRAVVTVTGQGFAKRIYQLLGGDEEDF